MHNICKFDQLDTSTKSLEDDGNNINVKKQAYTKTMKFITNGSNCNIRYNHLFLSKQIKKWYRRLINKKCAKAIYN